MSKTFEAVLAQYERNKNAASGNLNKVSNEERLKKYFVTILPPKAREGERRIRILPPKDDGSPFVEVYFHEIQVDGKWIKLFDPKQEGKRSPLDDVYKGLNATGDESDKELAKTYRARKFYIVKVIDRDNEQDGVKFWRFKHNSKGDGVIDKIFPIYKNKGDITDVTNGRDLIISLTLTKSGNGREYTTINSIIPDDSSPLHTDQEKIKEWVSDDLVWSDVYSKKPEEYLDLVAKGEVPKWSSDAKKWVSSGEAVVVIGKDDVEDVEDPQITDVPDDDLPF
jgi:hypothetical protein